MVLVSLYLTSWQLVLAANETHVTYVPEWNTPDTYMSNKFWYDIHANVYKNCTHFIFIFIFLELNYTKLHNTPSEVQTCI